MSGGTNILATLTGAVGLGTGVVVVMGELDGREAGPVECGERETNGERVGRARLY